MKRVLALLLLLLPGSLLAAQEGPGIVGWEARPGEGAVAATLRFPAGALADAPGAEGTAFLLGRVVEAEAGARLAAYGATVQVEVGLHHLEATLFAPASLWTVAWAEVTALLRSRPLPPEAVEAAQERALDELMFQEGSPERGFEVAWNGLRLQGLLPGGVEGARRPEGRTASLARLDAGTLEGWRATHLRWQEAVMAVVGDLTPDAVAGLGGRRVVALEGGMRGRATGAERTEPRPEAREEAPPGAPLDTLRPAEEPLPPLPPPALRLGTPAPPLVLPPGGIVARWAGARELLDREITSTWIGIAWALPRGTPPTLADFLAHVVGEALNPSPPDPNLYRARVTLERVEGIPLLVVVAATDPQAAYAWEARILEAVEALSDAPLPGAFLDLARRRYRSTRILEQADPLLRSRWVAAHLTLEGALPSVAEESWALRRSALATLVDSRGEPRILLKGPARMMATP